MSFSDRPDSLRSLSASFFAFDCASFRSLIASFKAFSSRFLILLVSLVMSFSESDWSFAMVLLILASALFLKVFNSLSMPSSNLFLAASTLSRPSF
jgi:hypothetical protein